MDYEKKYKEALERAKKFEEKYGGGYAEYIFPELSSSEDEMIRKELKEAFEAYDIESKWNGIPVRSIFAWLEKQKYNRLQPVYDNQESFESALDKAWKAYNDCGSRTVDSCEDDYIESAYAKGFREGYLFGLEKQKEQAKQEGKVPEQCLKCNEYEIGYKAGYEHGCTAGYNKAMKEKEQKPISFNVPFNPDDYEVVMEGNATGLKQKEQKPVSFSCGHENDKPAWSEEDEKMMDSIIKVVCGVGVQPNGLREKQVSFLKSLRPQYHGDVTMTEAYKMGLEAGKASSWKPSEEQMEALHTAMYLEEMQFYGGLKDKLRDLYVQLKKL